MQRDFLFRLKNVKRLIVCCLGILFFTGTTSFHKANTEKLSFENQIIHSVLYWYNIHLQLEAKDLNAYPPIAARRAAELGIAGGLLYHLHSSDIIYENKDVILLIHEVYANLLKKFYADNSEMLAQIEWNKNRLVTGMPMSIAQREWADCHSELILDTLATIQPLFHTITSDNVCSDSPLEQISNFSAPSPILPEWQQQAVYIKRNHCVEVASPFGNEIPNKQKKEALAVYYTTQHLSDHEKWIAEFWSDDIRGLTYSPVGRWISITNQLVNSKKLHLSQFFDVYFKLGIGLNDAITLCWKYKYLYAIARPSSIIQSSMDPTWIPMHDNPSFPSYPSGHAAIGNTATTILTAYFGDTISLTDKSHLDRIEFISTPRHFTSLTVMAKENALSRIYLGVHYPSDCSEGMKLGDLVGKNTCKVDFDTFFQDPNLVH